jgi:hypothetical protein
MLYVLLFQGSIIWKLAAFYRTEDHYCAQRAFHWTESWPSLTQWTISHFNSVRSIFTASPPPTNFSRYKESEAHHTLSNPAPPKTGGSQPVGSPQLLIQYILSYPPYLEAAFSILNLTSHSVAAQDPVHMKGTHRDNWLGGNALVFYSGGARFQSRPEYWPPWLRFSWFSSISP